MLSYRKLAMCVLGRPLHTGGGIDSPRPASQRAAAFILTAAMLTTLAAPAFAGTWYIEDGDITVKAGETEGTNKVSQGANQEVEDTDTIIKNREDTASSNTVTIEAEKKDDKVEVTLKDVNIDTSSRNKAAVSVTGSGNTTIKLDGDNHLTGGNGSSGISSSGSLTITGGETDSLTAKGGSGEDGGDGIFSKDLTISGGTVTATGGGSTGSDRPCGYGIFSTNTTTISGGTVTATGGDSTGSYSSGGYGIYSSGVTISGGVRSRPMAEAAKMAPATASSASTLSPSPAVPSRPKAAAAKTAKTAATASAASTLSPSPAVPSRPKAAAAKTAPAAAASSALRASPSPAVRSTPMAAAAKTATAAAASSAPAVSPSPAVRSTPLAATAVTAKTAATASTAATSICRAALS